jgi:PAS domain S-box-containing protein
MDQPAAPPPPAAPLPAPLLSAWLDQSHDLLALTDERGGLRWTNPAFEQATGLVGGENLLALAPSDWHRGAAHAALSAGLHAGQVPDAELALRSAAGNPLWVRARVVRVDADLLWTLQDTTASHALAAEAQRLSELLDMAQEFGRLGIWEREIPSGAGRWDRHVFGFWGMTPTDGTPDYAEAASRLHPDDQNSVYLDSTQRAGRYAQHYRVIRADGSLRWIHSQWEIKNSPEGIPVRTIGIMMDDTAVHELARSRDEAAAELRLVTRLAGIAIWRHDFQTDRIHYNEHGSQVPGIRSEARGMTLEEARASIHPDDVPKLAASAAHALATGAPVDVEVRYRRSDGAWRYFLVRRAIERGPSGQPLGFVGISLDVTGQVEQSRRAEQLARRLEAAAEAARIGIWTSVVGTRETEWNAHMYELFDRVDPAHPPTLGEWLTRCVHPADMERVTKTTRAFLRHEIHAFELEFRILTRDDRTRWMVLRAELDRSGVDPLRAFGMAMDVTERHESLTALHAASERAALIARHAGIGTWETDENGLPSLWDDQMWNLRGLTPQPLSMDRAERLSLVHPDDRARVLDAHPELGASPRPAAYEFRVRLPDGSYRWLASRSAVLLDEQGRVLRRVGVNWDITEAKNAELARQQVLLTARESQAKSQFLSRMSHELRTPLNAVLGFTQLLQLDARHSAENGQLARLDHIRAAGEHLLALIDDALDLSSLQTGTLKLELQPVPLAALIAEALPAVADLAASHGVSLQSGQLAVTVRADRARLRQALVSLISNAVRHNAPGGKVVIDASVEGAHALLYVRDTGRRMTAEQSARLFEPFSELGVQGNGIGSSGIGLAIARALIEGMDGTIVARSELGRGTVFELRLPRVEGAPERASSEPVSHSGQLLYIEDNSVNVLLVEELVKSLSGLQVVSEPTGAAGVARARAMRPNLVLIDMHLPDFDGFEVLRQLRANPETASIRCIALSANAIPEDIERALASGFDDYWTKPIRFKPFLQALERIFPAVDP